MKKARPQEDERAFSTAVTRFRAIARGESGERDLPEAPQVLSGCPATPPDVAATRPAASPRLPPVAANPARRRSPPGPPPIRHDGSPKRAPPRAQAPVPTRGAARHLVR